MNVGVINTKTSNIQSIYNTLDFLGISNYEEISIFKPELDNKYSHLIFPGNGSYKKNLDELKKNNLDQFIIKHFQKNKFFLGICVGMQVLSSYGMEYGKTDGLNIIPGEVIKLNENKVRLPHIGWNEVRNKKKDKIFESYLNDKQSFYFLHSYYFKTKEDKDILSDTFYGINFPTIIKKKNFYGVQFHPEKSQTAGINLIKNFLQLK